MLTEEKLARNDTGLETSLRKLLAQLVQNKNTCVCSICTRCSKTVHLHLFKTAVVHKLYNTDCEARLNFVNWYLLKNWILHSFF
jgi:hypothetical protein